MVVGQHPDLDLLAVADEIGVLGQDDQRVGSGELAEQVGTVAADERHRRWPSSATLTCPRANWRLPGIDVMAWVARQRTSVRT